MAESDPGAADPFRSCLRVAVSSLCTEMGFDCADSTALETVTEMTQSLLVELGRSARAFCELASRVEPVSADIVLSLVEMGIPVDGLKEYAMRSNRTTLPPPSQSVTSKQTAILHTGNKKRHPMHIPDHLPEMPDSHSYIRTPTHRQPVTDYESVREKAASQKRDVERALTRFIAKTGKIHNLFKTDDTNLFPLISCVKGEDEFKLPPYVDALIFKDQIFEEEEIERRPRKKKFERAEEDEDDDEDPIGDRSLRLNESIAESETG